MTRKEAVFQAIEVLSKDPKYKQVCDTLSSLMKDLPLVHWNKETILDAFKQFIAENNRFPKKEDMEGKNILPMRSTVERIFNMKYAEFRSLYFSDYALVNGSGKYIRSREYWVSLFKTEYVKMDYPTKTEYNKSRRSGMPCAEHLVRLCDCKSWNGLLNLCGLGQHYNPRNTKGKPVLMSEVKRPGAVDSIKIKELNAMIERIINVSEDK